MTRWTLVVSDETDRALRSFLAKTGGKKGSLSDFVEKAVQKQLFFQTIEAIQERNSKYDQEELMALVDEAVDHVRKTTPHH